MWRTSRVSTSAVGAPWTSFQPVSFWHDLELRNPTVLVDVSFFSYDMLEV